MSARRRSVTIGIQSGLLHESAQEMDRKKTVYQRIEFICMTDEFNSVNENAQYCLLYLVEVFTYPIDLGITRW